MKKLLLYLMALLAFGAVPVDALAAEYLVVPTAGNGWAIDEAHMVEVPGTSGTAKMLGVPIGTGKFAVGVYNTETDRVSWYKASTSKLNAPLYTQIDFTSKPMATPAYSSITEQQIINTYAVWSIAGASEGAVYDISVDTRQGCMTISIDYSLYQIVHVAAGDSNGAQISNYLNAGSSASFEINTGNSTSFKCWFVAPGANTTYCFGDGSGLNYKTDFSNSEYEDELNEVSESDLATASVISGLDDHATYRVDVNFKNALISIEKIPVVLYCTGDFAGGKWSNFPEDTKFTANFETYTDYNGNEVTNGLVYTGSWPITRTEDGTYFAINVGPDYDSKNAGATRYTLPSSGNNYWVQDKDFCDNNATQSTHGWLKLTSAKSDYHSMKMDKNMTENLLIKVVLDSENKPAYIWFEEDPGYVENPNYDQYLMTTYYGNGSFHVTRNISKQDGDWVGIDNGQIFSDPVDGIVYDGLRLGYDPFCIETVSPDGLHTYWGLNFDNGGLIPGQPYTFTAFETEEEAKANTKMTENPSVIGFVNSRYDIVWNFNTKEVTVTLNEVWKNAPNQMYLVRLTKDQADQLLPAANIKDYIDGKTEADGVFPIKFVSDGIYEANFHQDITDDLPKGSYFCIAGRTGVVYNVLNADDNGDSFLFGSDWLDGNNSYQLPLTSSDSQKPALINTDRIANTDFTVRVNANYSEGEFQNSYVITFTDNTGLPEKFIIYELADIAVGFNNTGNWSQVYVWAWNNDGNCVRNTSYPGDEMTKGEDGLYYWSAPDGKVPTSIIFTDGTDSNKKDCVFTNNRVYDASGNASVYYNSNSDTECVYFENTNNWSEVYVWAWDTGNGDANCNVNSNYPGDKLTKGEDGRYYWSAPAGKIPTKVKFTTDASNSKSTKDLDYHKGATYKPNGNTRSDVIAVPARQYDIIQIGSGDNYTLTPVIFNPGKKYKVVALIDGVEVQYGPAFSTSATEKVYNVNTAPINTQLLNNEGLFNITNNTNAKDLEYSAVTIKWNNGIPMFTAVPTGEKEKITVYFVDYEKWGDIHCYQYSDVGLTPINGSWEGVSAVLQNGNFPGVPMSVVSGSSDLKTQLGIPASDNSLLYSCQLDVRKLADGNYDMPKVIFANNNKKQTGNLFLVKGGIYHNGNDDLDVTEYLPESIYSYWNTETFESARVEEYSDTPYSDIYVDDPVLVQHVKEGKDLMVSLTFDRNGNGVKDYEAMGIPGTSKLVIQPINGKDYLRISVAEYIVPNNTEVNISFWPSDVYKGSDGKHDNRVSNFEQTENYKYADNVTVTPNHRDQGNDQTFTFKKMTYTGEHLMCYNTLCSLNFYNVNFSDGNVYRRYKTATGTQDPVVTISSLTKPDALYIVPTNVGGADAGAWSVAKNDYNAFAINPNNNTTYVHTIINPVTGNSVSALKLNLQDPENPEKLVYLIPEVTNAARFYVIAEFDGVLSCYSGRSASGVDMIPNQAYSLNKDYSNTYRIKEVGNPESYTIKISWTDATVKVVPNLKDAKFQFAMMNDENQLVTQLKSSLMIPAHRDECMNTGHLTKIYFKYAKDFDDYFTNNGDGSKSNRFDNVEVTWQRDTEYDKYFAGTKSNLQAHLVERNSDNLRRGEILCNKYVVIESDAALSANTGTNYGYAYVYVQGYTASTGRLTIAYTKQDDDTFDPSKVTVPVRIFPTIEGLGLVINDILVESDKNNNYSVKIANDNHNDGNVEFRDRLQIEATTADHKINGNTVIRYYWSMDPEPTDPEKKPVVRRDGTLVENPNKSALIQNVDDDPFEGKTDPKGNELSEYSIYNAPRIAVGNKNATPVYLQLEQNGMKSPVYTVNVNRDDALTGIEEIEVEESYSSDDTEAEVFYYNLNGVRVNADRLEQGIYVKVQGSKSEKVYVR